MDANLGVQSGMLQPDIILPTQYVAPRKLAPEHGLMIAVLRDAIDCVAKHRNAEDYRGRRLFDEATQWLLAEESDWPYSFESICAVLDLDANAVRHALRLPERQSVLVCGARSTMPHTNAVVGPSTPAVFSIEDDPAVADEPGRVPRDRAR